MSSSKHEVVLQSIKAVEMLTAVSTGLLTANHPLRLHERETMKGYLDTAKLLIHNINYALEGPIT